MKITKIGGFSNIKDYAKDKIAHFEKETKDFDTLFRYMFSERDNTMIETTDGYRIKKVTYGEFHDSVELRAATLSVKLRDVPHGSYVGLYMSNSPLWISALWAVLMCGYRPLIMNTRLADEVLEAILRDNSVGVVISDGKQFSVLTLNAEDALLEADIAYQSERFGDEVVFMSSGTTDSVKLCAYTAENFFYQISDSGRIITESRAIHSHYEGELKQLVLLPLCHVFGFIAVYTWFTFFSRTLVFPNDLTPMTIQNTVKKHKVTHIFAVPMVFDKVCHAAIKKIRQRGDKTYRKFCRALKISNALGDSLGGAFAKRAFSEIRDGLFGNSIKCLISGGSKVDTATLEFFNGIGYPIANGYGMTEIGITSVEVSSKNKVRNSGSIGHPFGNTEYKTEDGELFVRGRTMASRITVGGVSEHTDFDKWFSTKDLATREGERYFLGGRRDDLIVCKNGENLNPEIVERRLDIVGADAVCLFADHEGEATLLISAPGVFSEKEISELYKNAADVLGREKLEGEVTRVVITPDPLLGKSDFKISRKKIASRLAKGEIRVIDPHGIGDYIEEITSTLERDVRAMFASALERDPESVGITDGFFVDLGGSSLEYFTLLSDIKVTYGKELPIEDGTKLLTVRDFCDFILNN